MYFVREIFLWNVKCSAEREGIYIISLFGIAEK